MNDPERKRAKVKDDTGNNTNRCLVGPRKKEGEQCGRSIFKNGSWEVSKSDKRYYITNSCLSSLEGYEENQT